MWSGIEASEMGLKDLKTYLREHRGDFTTRELELVVDRMLDCLIDLCTEKME